jgi:hypothetical protein
MEVVLLAMVTSLSTRPRISLALAAWSLCGRAE